MKILVEYILIKEYFPAEEVHQAIDIESCEIIHAGDEIRYGTNGQGKRIETHTSITYSTGYMDTSEMELVLKAMFDMLNEKKELIQYYIQKYALTSKFWITINLSENPIMYIPQEFVRLAAELNAAIEFDTYVS